MPNLTQALKETNWYGELPFTRKPTVAFITPEQVVDIIDKSGGVTDHTFVTAMGLLRVGSDTFQQQSNSSSGGSIREKFDRILRV